MKKCSLCGEPGHNKRRCPGEKPKITSSIEGYTIGDVYYFKSYGMKQVHRGEIVAVYPNEPELCVGIRDWADGSTRTVAAALLGLKKTDAVDKSAEYFLTTDTN